MPNLLRREPVTVDPRSEPSRLDAIDRRIVRLLVENGRMATCQVADSIGLSESAVSTRLRKLLRGGVISGIHAHIDPTVVGRSYHVSIGVRLSQSTLPAVFESQLAGSSAIIDAWQVTGNLDYQLRIACRDMTELDRTLVWLRRAGAEDTTTSFLLRRIAGTGDANLLAQ